MNNKFIKSKRSLNINAVSYVVFELGRYLLYYIFYNNILKHTYIMAKPSSEYQIH